MKKLLSFVICFFSIFLFSCVSFASSTTKYDNAKQINVQKNNISLSGNYPVISNLTNGVFQKNVNQKIENIINSKTSTYSSNAKKTTVSYDSVLDGEYLSIILYFKNTYTNEIDISSLSFSTKTNKYISINTILGENGINYTNKVVASKASSQNITYKKVTKDTPFYVKNNNVYILFGAGEITFAQKGNITFEVLSANIKSYKISKESYYKKSQYNVKMVPLRGALEYFNYTTKWQAETNSITVLKDNNFTSYIVIGENKYSNKNSKFIRNLEFAPEIKSGITYVPVSYFSEILGLLFTTDANENIIISSYSI